jgi:hypothetical protein
MCDSWDDPIWNPWTYHKNKGQFEQLCVMLHFNNNEDIDGVEADYSLPKIMLLLNIVKKPFQDLQI